MKSRQLIYIVLAIGCLGIGVGIGSRWHRSDGVAQAATSDPSVTEKKIELAKLALAAGGIQRALDQPASNPPRDVPASPLPAMPPADRSFTAREERDAHLKRLQESGAPPADFAGAMREVEGEWRALARANHVEVD